MILLQVLWAVDDFTVEMSQHVVALSSSPQMKAGKEDIFALLLPQKLCLGFLDLFSLIGGVRAVRGVHGPAVTGSHKSAQHRCWPSEV